MAGAEFPGWGGAMEAWPEEGPLANRGELSTSCLPCFKRHIKCERRIPCLRCIRLGLHCEPNPNPRGRPKKDSGGSSTSSVNRSAAQGQGANASQPAVVSNTRRLIPPDHGPDLTSTDLSTMPDTRECAASLAALMSSGDVEVDRSRRLLTAWRTCMTRRGWTSFSHQLEEMSRILRIPLNDVPTHSMIGDARMWDEDRQLQLFLERFDDADGSATCKITYRFGEISIHTSSRFAGMYMNGQELEENMTRTGLRPELVWKNLFSPENHSAFYDLLNRACFQHGEFGGETSDILKCMDRYDLKLACLVRLRIFVSSAGGAAICMLLLLPLEPSRHLHDVL